jgi:hypothetical protein
MVGIIPLLKTPERVMTIALNSAGLEIATMVR